MITSGATAASRDPIYSAGVAAWTFAQTPATPLRVIAFDGGWNLPVWAAQRQGFFEANGVAVQLAFTPNSAFTKRAAASRKLGTPALAQ